jgi:dihydrofolate synthase/folylpolyglutamate synthase
VTYPEAITFLYGLQRHGIKLGLETTAGLLSALSDPHTRYPSFHIGGTNGKGSTAAVLAAILQAAGHRVGLYTSPHLIDFRERIRVNGVPIAEQDVAALAGRLKEAMPVTTFPTFFEFTTAMAFSYFADCGVDVAVVEVGMGGRFDATNVLVPLASAITNVALDHQEYLGETVPAIAFEKAGIIKTSVPLVVGHLRPEAAEVIGAIAHERSAPQYALGQAFQAHGHPDRFDYAGIHQSYRDLSCPLAGQHQLDNAACALALLELGAAHLPSRPDMEEAVRTGLREVHWPGRLEVVEEHPTVLLDGAHNPAAAEVVARYLQDFREAHPGSRVVLVLGMMRDKDMRSVMKLLFPLADEVILTQARHDRAATVRELRACLPDPSPPAHDSPGAVEALALAKGLAETADLVCVTGSLMLVGELKASLARCELSPIRG